MEAKKIIVESEEIEGGIKFTAKGHINALNSGVLEQELENAINKGHKRIILNLVQVDFLSSSGIRILIKTYKTMKNNGGVFNIEKPSENVKNVLGITALDSMLLK